ncbi:hypothetical protein TWF694_001416 [Orbilia ellipsospora]|uniref:Polyketide synthase n=1 Tax=Orbilia ellipsospora TaxID=2528407 RepID=A0AAV9XTE3_9PEZI
MPSFLRAGVSSFGYGGANGHAILESADTHLPREYATKSRGNNHRSKYLLPFSGSSTEALNARVNDITSRYNLEAASIEDLAYTLGCRRSHLERRGYLLVSKEQFSAELTLQNLRTVPKSGFKSPSETAYTFVFTGQGAQWPQMCKELFQEFAVFSDAIDEMDAVLQRIPHPAKWKLKDALLEPKLTSKIMDPSYSQACCIGVQVALTLLLRSWGIIPSAVVGHSSGEVAAAFAAGHLSLAQAIINAYYRGFVTTKESIESFSELDFGNIEGGMIAAGLSEKEANAMINKMGLVGQIKVACVNSPSSVTISGDNLAIEDILNSLQEGGFFVRKLQTQGRAYHSHHMKPFGEAYFRYLELVNDNSFAKTSTKLDQGPVWVSSVTGKVFDEDLVGSLYWRRNLEEVVQFSKAVSKLCELRPQTTMIELGPHSALELPLKQIRSSLGINEEKIHYSAAIIRHKDAVESVLNMAGQLFLYGHPVSFAKINGLSNQTATVARTEKVCGYRVLHDLPAYHWTYSESPLWYEPRASSEYRLREYPRHELLGVSMPGGNGLERTWRNTIRLEDSTWLRDHKLGGSVVFPGAGYLAMAIEALVQTVGQQRYTNSLIYMEDVKVLSVLVVPERSSDIELFTTLRPKSISFSSKSKDWWDFSIVSFRDGASTIHATGSAKIKEKRKEKHKQAKFAVSEEILDLAAPRTWYNALRKGGLDLGPTFQPVTEFGLSRLRGLKYCSATIPAAETLKDKNQRYLVHPTVLDVVFQAAVIATSAGNTKDLTVKVPTHIGSATFSFDAEPEDAHSYDVENWKVHCRAPTTGFGYAQCDAEIVGPNEVVKARLENFRIASFEGRQLEAVGNHRHPMLRVAWKPDPSPRFMTNKALASYSETAAHQSSYFNSTLQNLSAYLSIISHKNPYLEILELGDGGENMMKIVLESLSAQSEFPLLSSYNYGKLKDLHNSQPIVSEVDLKTNLLMNPGLLKSGKKFDLIIVSAADSVTEETRNKSWKSLKELLNLEGAILQFSGLESHNESLRENGLEAIVSTNSWGPVALIHHIQEAASIRDLKGNTIFVLEYTQTPFGDHLVQELFLVTGLEPRRIIFSEISQDLIPAGSIVVSLLEIQTPESIFSRVSGPEFENIKILVEQAATLLWVTNGDLLTGRNPNHSFAFGLSRAVRLEQPSLKFIVYDVDDPTIETQKTVQNIVSTLTRTSSIADTEFVEKNGMVHISRFVPDNNLNGIFQLSQGAIAAKMPLKSFWKATTPKGSVSDFSAISAQLCIKTPGQFNSLFFKQISLPRLESHQVQVSVRSVGLNAKDIYALSGKVDTKRATCALEFCGIVEKLGAESSCVGLAVGDRVYVMAPSYLRTSEIVPHWACFRIGDDEQFGPTSAAPFVYATAIYALCDRARLQKGEKILIHSGAGGVGIAAIQLSQQIGAGEIFTTVSTAEKKDFLIKSLGIKPQNIFDSRDASFEAQIMDATNGEGVDVVLNSLTGDLLHSSWKCCGSFGRFVEIGKRDLTEGGQLNMGQFLKNATYTAFDLSELFESSNPIHHKIWSDLISRAFKFYRGLDSANLPLEIFDVENISDAFRKFSSKSRIGKISVSLERPDSLLNVTPSYYSMEFSSKKAYVMIGCLGGLGRSLSKYMFERGARKFVFLSRSGLEKPPARRIIQDLRTLGAECDIIKGDVCCINDVKKVIGQADILGPIGGIIHAAMGASQTIFKNMSKKSWGDGVDPKAKGAWNIHEAIKGKDTSLDFFLLTSSITGTLGAAAESNYTAANCFLDYFARYRRSLGLPATAIGLGMISEVGFLHDNPEIENLLLRRGVQQFTESEMLSIVDISLSASASASVESLYDVGSAAHVLTGLEASRLAQGSGSAIQDPRASILARSVHRKGGPTYAKREGLPDEMARAIECGANLKDALTKYVAKRFGELILVPEGKLNLTKPLNGYGMDSMIAAEFRSWFYQTFKVDVPFLDLLSKSITIESLSQNLLKQVQSQMEM